MYMAGSDRSKKSHLTVVWQVHSVTLTQRYAVLLQKMRLLRYGMNKFLRLIV